MVKKILSNSEKMERDKPWTGAARGWWTLPLGMVATILHYCSELRILSEQRNLLLKIKFRQNGWGESWPFYVRFSAKFANFIGGHFLHSQNLLFFVNTPISLPNDARARAAQDLLLTISFQLNVIISSNRVIRNQLKSFAIFSRALSPPWGAAQWTVT